MTLTNQLKTHLTNQVGQKVTARDSLYKEVKNQLFYDFNVSRWEDIPVSDFYKVNNYTLP